MREAQGQPLPALRGSLPELRQGLPRDGLKVEWFSAVCRFHSLEFSLGRGDITFDLTDLVRIVALLLGAGQLALQHLQPVPQMVSLLFKFLIHSVILAEDARRWRENLALLSIPQAGAVTSTQSHRGSTEKAQRLFPDALSR